MCSPPQAFNWLLCNVIQTTSLHDILWHFVASLTPSPFEPEDEEEDENKGNKEIVEQVMTLKKKRERKKKDRPTVLLLLYRCTFSSQLLLCAPYRRGTLAFASTPCLTL